jgi:hypothetical protein
MVSSPESGSSSAAQMKVDKNASQKEIFVAHSGRDFVALLIFVP